MARATPATAMARALSVEPIDLPQPVAQLAIAPAGALLAVSRGGAVHLFDPTTRTARVLGAGGPADRIACLLADGRVMMVRLPV